MRNGRKVIFLVSFMNKAGAQRAAHRVARGLAQRGWEAELWFLYKNAEDAFPDVPVKVFHDGPSPNAKGYLRILRDVVLEMRRARPDAVVSFLPLASIVGQAAALLAGVPRRIASLRSPGTTFDTPMRQLDRLYGQLGLYTRIVAVSQAVADEAEGYPSAYRRRISVVHNGVNPIETNATQAEARAALGLPADARIALSVGRMAPQKNYPYLLDIAEKLVRAHLVCVGDGPERAWIEDEIAKRGLADRITLTGALPADRIPLAYKAADLFVQPSLFEGQSNTLLEAMSIGLPVIVSDVPSQTETVIGADGQSWGLALPLDDPGRWATEIDRLATDATHASHMGTLAAARAGDFTVKGQIDGFEAVLLDQKPTVPPARRVAAFVA